MPIFSAPRASVFPVFRRRLACQLLAGHALQVPKCCLWGNVSPAFRKRGCPSFLWRPLLGGVSAPDWGWGCSTSVLLGPPSVNRFDKRKLLLFEVFNQNSNSITHAGMKYRIEDGFFELIFDIRKLFGVRYKGSLTLRDLYNYSCSRMEDFFFFGKKTSPSITSQVKVSSPLRNCSCNRSIRVIVNSHSTPCSTSTSKVTAAIVVYFHRF